MKYQEELSWILDYHGAALRSQDEKYQQNIDFVHSLGLKCDCVGWSTLRKDDPNADEILEKIAGFCKANNWTARGLYSRKYTDFDTDWYQIKGEYFKDGVARCDGDIPAQGGGAISATKISAYRELSTGPKASSDGLYLPERFRNAYIRLGLSGLDFCWVRDTGRYAAEQYFKVYISQLIPNAVVGWNLKKQDLHHLGPDGGWLPRLAQVFQDWTQINLPYCYRKKDMPAGGFAYAYIPSSFFCCGLYQVLVHKDTAAQLLHEKALPAHSLVPVPVLEEIPCGYTLHSTANYPRPAEAYMVQSILNYEDLLRKPRPAWKVSEKDALKLLRRAKSERKEAFGKKLSRASAESLADTIYARMLAYYLVANGGELSDEYRLLSYEASKTDTLEFRCQMQCEELLEQPPDGIVIARCPDGDWVLLLQDDTVVRFSHEAPEIVDQWSTLPQFIADALDE